MALFRTCLALCAIAFPALAAGPIVLIVGLPGSGKSTQSELLKKGLGLTVIAADDADFSKALVLDGYPAAKIQGHFLTRLRQKHQLPPPLIVHLSLPDNVVRSRVSGQQRPELEQQIEDYHREFDFIRDYFPEANIRPIDGTRVPADIAEEIRKLLQGAPELTSL